VELYLHSATYFMVWRLVKKGNLLQPSRKVTCLPGEAQWRQSNH